MRNEPRWQEEALVGMPGPLRIEVGSSWLDERNLWRSSS